MRRLTLNVRRQVSVALVSCLLLAVGSPAPRPQDERSTPEVGEVARTPMSRAALSPDRGVASGPTSDPLGALRRLPGLDRRVSGAALQRLLNAADAVVHDGPHASNPIEVNATDGPFVVDAQAAWTLALAGRETGRTQYWRASAAIVEAWVSVGRSTRNACAHSGGCSTSLMVSRSAPGLIFATDLLVASGWFGPGEEQRFHQWLRKVIVPAASDRNNNWGDAGTYLLAVAGSELGDRALQDRAARRWRDRLDLIRADGAIPEEMRRGRASLMYSQEALDYKVATADVLGRSGIDLWDARGAAGGTIRAALDLVASGLADPHGWPGGGRHLRVPEPSGGWAIAAGHWRDSTYARLAEAAGPSDGKGHSSVLWTGITHGDRP